MYSSHINFIFVSACYMLLVTDKSKYGSTAATLLQKQLNISNNQLILQFHKLMICTGGTQVQDLYLKNKLSRSYSKLKLIINKKSYKKIIQVFLFNKSFKRLDHSKVFVQLSSMSINDDLGEYQAICIYIL